MDICYEAASVSVCVCVYNVGIYKQRNVSYVCYTIA